MEKHMSICQKSTLKKRKVFDSSRQRAEGTDISTLKPLKPKPEPPKKQSNWRRKHEEFIASIRAAKSINQAIKDGGPLPPPPPPSYDPDYIQCPYCQRRFGQNAAERHINFCKDQASRIPNKGKFPGDAKGKLPARSQYKPPPVKKTSTPAVSTVSPSSRLPQRPPGQYSGISASKTTPTGLSKNPSTGYAPARSNVTGLTSPPSRVNVYQKTSSGIGIKNKKDNIAENNSSSNLAQTANEVDGTTSQMSKFCHECGTKYPLDSAKFCCECGMRRMCV
ncbi:zinc finger C2HC domain-containing protein 1A isoform X2 [Denticeps clupeoides]|uniref:zinc finger C2HC domain-containing protein 1A isoform X2 n=1 Tax=Denticeps clupeoides TaxID=299321 RepID=UPI0010A49F8D|nr:zinc finger C2HC domain-containing protein 1A isoform X2 [Denticeps clupeoides]